MPQIQGVRYCAERVQGSARQKRHVAHIDNGEKHRTYDGDSHPVGAIVHQEGINGGRRSAIRHQPGKPAVVAVHKEHHAQTKQSRMLGNYAPHQHFGGTRQGRLRVKYAADEQP